MDTARTMGNLSRGENKRPVQREGTSKCLMLSHPCSHKCNFCSISALALGRVAGLPSQLTGRCIGTSSKVSSSSAAGSIAFSTDRHGVGASAFCTDVVASGTPLCRASLGKPPVSERRGCTRQGLGRSYVPSSLAGIMKPLNGVWGSSQGRY